jgi:hypothetical protein
MRNPFKSKYELKPRIMVWASMIAGFGCVWVAGRYAKAHGWGWVGLIAMVVAYLGGSLGIIMLWGLLTVKLNDLAALWARIRR